MVRRWWAGGGGGIEGGLASACHWAVASKGTTAGAATRWSWAPLGAKECSSRSGATAAAWYDRVDPSGGGGSTVIVQRPSAPVTPDPRASPVISTATPATGWPA